MATEPKLILSPGPHLHTDLTTKEIMWWVNGALAPLLLWAVYIFGMKVIVLLASSVVGALFGEWIVNRLRGRQQTMRDGSAVLTGLLLVGTISPGVPVWMPAVGSFVAIVFAKMLFGGLGWNIFNPALIGRTFLMATFPVAMTTTWSIHGVTQATPLTTWKLDHLASHHYIDLIVGTRAGSIGEVSVILIFVGAMMLLMKGIIKLYIPVSVIVGLLLVSLVTGEALFHLLTGGLWFGAFFMATDYVTAPLLPKAQVIFGLGIGLITGVIRVWGGYPEGICYAILMMNAVTPALNQWFRPRRPAAEVFPS